MHIYVVQKGKCELLGTRPQNLPESKLIKIFFM